MKYNYFVQLLLIFPTFARICQNGLSSDCLDITSEEKCQGQISGRFCIWDKTNCNYSSCEQQINCPSEQILLGKQCFLNKANQCTSSSTCSDFDHEIACSTFQSVKCFWDGEKCRDAICGDFLTQQICFNTIINSKSCFFTPDNICIEDSCQIRPQAYCNGRQVDGKKCIFKSESCQEMGCDDVSPCQYFSLSDAKKCISCQEISSCTQISNQNDCEIASFEQEICFWEQVRCRKKNCVDFKQEECGGNCTWDTFSQICMTCKDITDICQCNTNANCFWVYDGLTNLSYCQKKRCEIYFGSEECRLYSCDWNQETQVCKSTSSLPNNQNTGTGDQEQQINQQNTNIMIVSTVVIICLLLS